MCEAKRSTEKLSPAATCKKENKISNFLTHAHCANAAIHVFHLPVSSASEHSVKSIFVPYICTVVITVVLPNSDSQ
jgi:hypothetical protein